MEEVVERRREVIPIRLSGLNSAEILGTQCVKYYTNDTISINIKFNEKWVHLARDYDLVMSLYPSYFRRAPVIDEDHIIRGTD